jgi:hypothetical protein
MKCLTSTSILSTSSATFLNPSLSESTLIELKETLLFFDKMTQACVQTGKNTTKEAKSA